MLARLIIIILISLPSLFTQQVYKGEPRWYFNPPVRKGMVYGVGSGKLKMEAIVSALGNIASKMETKIESRKTPDSDDVAFFRSTTGDFLSNFTQGKFSLSTIVRDFYEDGGVDGGGENSFASSTSELKYQDSLGALAIIKHFMEESGIGENAKSLNNFEASYSNTDESALIEELEGYGFKFTYARDKDSHYVLMSIKSTPLNRASKKE